LYRQTSDTLTLFAVLESFQDADFAAVKSGKLITATSSEGINVQYAAPSLFTTFTQDQVFSLSEELIALYESVVADLAAVGNNSPTDADIFNRMIASNALATVTEEYSSYTTAFWQGR
jgi:hypothetical protein